MGQTGERTEEVIPLLVLSDLVHARRVQSPVDEQGATFLRARSVEVDKVLLEGTGIGPGPQTLTRNLDVVGQPYRQCDRRECWWCCSFRGKD